MKLLLNELTDKYVRENFRRLQVFLNEKSPLAGFVHYDITVTNAVANYKFAHNLGAIPQDIFQTFITGTGAVTYNYSNFDKNFIDITTTGPVHIRGFLGTFKPAGQD